MIVEGKNHEHEHGHEHSHEHGHGHVRAHIHQEPAADGLSIEEHEGALVASFVQGLEGTLAAAETDWTARLESLAGAVTLAGGTVGHIKASITHGPSVSTLSTTGGKPAVTRNEPTQCAIETVVIVFGLDENALRGIVSQVLL
jgi:hypothetical protein